MPLVPIEVEQGRSAMELRHLADVVHEIMHDVFAAPPGDKHRGADRASGRSGDRGGLRSGLRRTTDVILQIFHQGRSERQKTPAYQQIALRLEKQCGLSPHDLIVSMTENGRSDWSFGEGRAQILTASSERSRASIPRRCT